MTTEIKLAMKQQILMVKNCSLYVHMSIATHVVNTYSRSHLIDRFLPVGGKTFFPWKKPASQK